MSQRWEAYAHHILDTIEKIKRIQNRGDLARDEVLYDATLRNLQTLSEATQRLPDSLKALFQDIPWKEINGFRNILVHNYLGDIDSRTVLAIVDSRLELLENAVRAMLDMETGNDE